jgi:rRNA maturation endonuclease Nob1
MTWINLHVPSDIGPVIVCEKCGMAMKRGSLEDGKCCRFCGHQVGTAPIMTTSVFLRHRQEKRP